MCVYYYWSGRVHVFTFPALFSRSQVSNSSLEHNEYAARCPGMFAQSKERERFLPAVARPDTCIDAVAPAAVYCDNSSLSVLDGSRIAHGGKRAAVVAVLPAEMVRRTKSPRSFFPAEHMTSANHYEQKYKKAYPRCTELRCLGSQDTRRSKAALLNVHFYACRDACNADERCHGFRFPKLDDISVPQHPEGLAQGSCCLLACRQSAGTLCDGQGLSKARPSASDSLRVHPALYAVV